MNELQEKVIVVTGGGQGLGAAISSVLAEAGATVAIADLKQENAQALAEQISQNGGKAVAYRLDVSDPESVSRAVGQVIARHGRIDALVNNAGTDVSKPITELTVEEWDRVVGVNLRGPFLMTKAVLPGMLERGSGNIVNITSTAAKRAWTEASVYHATKWGLLGFSHATHTEGRKGGVKVTAVVAGGMKTPFILDRFPEAEPNLQDPKNVAETVRYVLTQPAETVIAEVTVLPLKETSWP